MHPESPERYVTEEQIADFYAFLKDSFPVLANEPLVGTRICLYTLTPDEDFLIARDPEVNGLTIATGGSGHAFKFGPLFGKWIADATEGKLNPDLERFRWRF